MTTEISVMYGSEKVKEFYLIRNNHKCQLFPVHLNTYVMGLRQLHPL